MKITIDDLSKMSIAELTSLNQNLIRVIKLKRGLEGAEKAQSLKLNQEVKINSPKFVNDTFIVTKINKTKAVCQLKGSHVSYNVPFSMIK